MKNQSDEDTYAHRT